MERKQHHVPSHQKRPYTPKSQAFLFGGSLLSTNDSYLTSDGGASKKARVDDEPRQDDNIETTTTPTPTTTTATTDTTATTTSTTSHSRASTSAKSTQSTQSTSSSATSSTLAHSTSTQLEETYGIGAKLMEKMGFSAAENTNTPLNVEKRQEGIGLGFQPPPISSITDPKEKLIAICREAKVKLPKFFPPRRHRVSNNWVCLVTLFNGARIESKECKGPREAEVTAAIRAIPYAKWFIKQESLPPESRKPSTFHDRDGVIRRDAMLVSRQNPK